MPFHHTPRTQRPAPERPIAHPEVDRALIGRLVRDFYARVRRDDHLGPIFASVVHENWEAHLARMTDFWCAVILKDGSYSGRPVPVHLKLKQVREADFEIWLAHFRAAAEEGCPPGMAEIFIERAERIAQSLRLAMFFRIERPGNAV